MGVDPVTSEITNYRDAFSLDGKVALVTGAAGTLGAEICRGLTSVGASVLITDIVEDRGVALRDELRASGANAEFFKHNVTEASEWDAAVKMAVDSFGGLDAVVNAAAIVPMRLLEDLDVEEFKKVQDINLTSTMRLCKGVLRGMMKARWGRIINVSSIVGATGNPGQANYAASKAGLIGFTKSVAAELGYAQHRHSLQFNPPWDY